MKSKYLKGKKLEDWFMHERKGENSWSKVWKAFMEAFPLVGK